VRGWDAKAAPNGFKPHVVLRFGQFSQAARATRQKRIDILSISALSLDLKDYTPSKRTQASYVERRIFKI
jgi:hypothetical protein